jgi:hypothetical protein
MTLGVTSLMAPLAQHRWPMRPLPGHKFALPDDPELDYLAALPLLTGRAIGLW